MAKVVLLEGDYKIAKQIKETLDKHTTPHEVFAYASPEETLAKLNEEKVDIALIAGSALGNRDAKLWLEEWKTKITLAENQKIQYIFLEFDTPTTKIRKILAAGFRDFMVKPVDSPLLIQKLDLLLSTSGSAEKQVYSMQVNLSVNVALDANVVEISEFGATLQSNRKVNEEEIISLYSEIFGENNLKGEVLGRCYKSIELTDKKGEFQSKIVFVGVDTHVLKLIRSWLRKEYVNKKQQTA